MTYGLVRVPQTARAENVVAVHDDSILHRAAKRLSSRAHRFDIRRPAERPAVAEFTHEAAVRQIQRFALLAYCAVFEVDMEVHRQTRTRTQTRPALSGMNFDRTQNLDHADRRGETFDPSGKKAPHERRSAAVEDRNFGSVDPNQCVVYPTAGQRGHHVLDRGNGYASSVQDHRAKRRMQGMVERGRNSPVAQTNVGALENDTMIGRRRAYAQRDRKTGMQTDTRVPGGGLNGCLQNYLKRLCASARLRFGGR